MADAVGDWTPADFERNSIALSAVIREHFESIRNTPVAAPADSARLVASLEEDLPEHAETFARLLDETTEKVVPGLVHWNHPRFFGYFPTCASFTGVLAETLTAALNVNAMLWHTSPAASALELVVLRWLAELVGYPTDSDGVLVSGASLATLYALAAARDASVDGDAGRDGTTGAPTLRIYTSDQAHSSVEKAAITLGIGAANVVRIPSDAEYRLRPDLLREAIERDIAAGARPVAVVATVGTTSVAAADPLRPLAQLCREYGIWLHVDAAYGAFYRLVPELRDRLEDLSCGDSLVVNPQKTLFVPLDSTALFCRRKGVLANTFRLVPDYLTSTHDGETVDFMDFSPQLGRGFRALKLWWVIKSFGRAGLASRLDHAVRLADWLRARASRHPDWRCPASSPYPLVCLRYEPPELAGERELLDELNAGIVAAVNAEGTAFVSHSVIRDGYVIRVSIGNIRTTDADVARLWEVLTGVADRQPRPLASPV
jgi:aromatic-L-amino-acid decarboxylase